MKLSRTQLAEYLIANPSKRAAQQVGAYLIGNGRSKEVDTVLRQVEAELNKRGRTVTHVSSAHKLDADQQRSIVMLVKQLRTDIQSVEVINQVDPSLLGGVVIRTPEMEVDVSLRGRLNRLARAAEV